MRPTFNPEVTLTADWSLVNLQSAAKSRRRKKHEEKEREIERELKEPRVWSKFRVPPHEGVQEHFRFA